MKAEADFSTCFFQANIYLFKFDNKNTGKICET